ncbi:MAG: DNA methylase [Clostridia bacterium]|nr:DNA methylase [Clostridia bacterium]
MQEKTYIAIDLKSFYASAECASLGLDPLGVNLVVADASRTEKTICLAVSPSLKAYGIPGRARLFEVVEKVREINAERLRHAPGGRFTGSSFVASELAADPSLMLDFIAAKPRMRHYMDVSAQVFSIYSRFVSPEDIHVYSVDEVFIDATSYLPTYGLAPRDFALKMIHQVLAETGVTATAGIGTNLYLAKVAMDVMAKRIPADRDGVRIAELDEMRYRQELWDHTPITDFWRIGGGYRRRLESKGLYTMGDVARCSIGKESDYYNEDLLYKLFGINAELLIDHAWGIEPCTIADIKAYRPVSTSLSNGQVLPCPYSAAQAKLILKEMTDQLSLSLAGKRLVTDQIVLTVCYDVSSAKDYQGELRLDHYGRPTPKEAHGSENLGERTNSTKALLQAAARLYDRIVDPALAVRRIYVVANHTLDELAAERQEEPEQLSLFTDYAALAKEKEKKQATDRKEKRMQGTILDIRGRYGKNAILRGMNYEEGATAKERNNMVGGHMG